MNRCDWCLGDTVYEQYHDEEWGRLLHDDQKLFEMLILEGMQAGLSWITILRKRESFRKAFDYFDYEKVARYGEEKILELLDNPGIIRYRLKIESAIQNAKHFLDIRSEFGSFDQYIWSFTAYKQVINHPISLKEIPTRSLLSDVISKDLKKRGFKFVGSVTIYSYLQAVGIIDDHLESCFIKQL